MIGGEIDEPLHVNSIAKMAAHIKVQAAPTERGGIVDFHARNGELRTLAGEQLAQRLNAAGDTGGQRGRDENLLRRDGEPVGLVGEAGLGQLGRQRARRKRKVEVNVSATGETRLDVKVVFLAQVAGEQLRLRNEISARRGGNAPAKTERILGVVAAAQLLELLRRLYPTTKPAPVSKHSLLTAVQAAAKISPGETLPRLAKRLGISESHLRARFRREAGLSLGRYLREARLREAALWLREEGLSVKAAAERAKYPESSLSAGPSGECWAGRLRPCATRASDSFKLSEYRCRGRLCDASGNR